MLRHFTRFAFVSLFLIAAWSFQGPAAPTSSADTASPFIKVDGHPDWLRVREGFSFSADALLRQHATQLGLSDKDELRLIKRQADPQGFIHSRYQQYHYGIVVEGGQLILHGQGDRISHLNGKLARNMEVEQPGKLLSPEQAIARVLDIVQAEQYTWQNTVAERLLKRVRRDPAATHYPTPELIWFDPERKQQGPFHLAYRMLIHADRPHLSEWIYIDAANGSLLDRLENLHTHNTPGTAVTKYSGVREIITDSIAPNSFRLRETTRGGGIETYNLQRRTEVSQSIDFFDDDNYWDNFNANQDEVATDAHWGAASTFDYFAEKHDYIGVDGEGMPLISYVHYGNNVVNAFWNGNWATFGDGDGTNYTSLATLDVVAHEFVHGITRSTANLVYRNESGALNESFSDIFGAVVEFYASPELADWTIAEDAQINGDGFRNMQNPSANGHPDTYQGLRWFRGSGDNGGVHSNSGVQNHWFYLLTEGGEGTNDNAEDFAVVGLGLDTASAIAFRNLQFYLTEFSQYADARLGAIQAATDLFGDCSEAVKQTTNAWQAVGVGTRFARFDLQPLRLLNIDSLSCGFPEDRSISLSLRYTSCEAAVSSGQPIPLAFQVNEGAVHVDTFYPPQGLQHLDTFNFTFAIPAAELAQPANHRLRVWTDFELDNISSNDTLTFYVDNIIAQNTDLATEQVFQPTSGCFMTQERVQVEIGFYGCDSLSAGTLLTAYYRLNGGPLATAFVTVPRTLYRGQRFVYTFEKMVDLPVQNGNELEVWIDYVPDFLNDNDRLGGVPAANPIPMPRQTVLTFEGGDASIDSFFVEAGPQAQVSLSEEGAFNSSTGLLITGSNSFEAYQAGLYDLPANNDTVWALNPDYGARVCICADLSETEQPLLQFDLRQNWSPVFVANQVGGSSPRVCSMRLLIDGQQIGNNYSPTSLAPAPFSNEMVDLSDYAGQRVEICFETRTGMSIEQDPLNRGDRIALDNIRISDALVSTQAAEQAQGQFRLFPNPGRAELWLQYEARSSSQAQLQVYSLTGQLVWERPIRLSAGDNLIAIPAQPWPAGVYQFRLGLDGEHISQQWVKF